MAPLRIDHRRRIIETATAGKIEIWEQISGFQATIFCIRTVKAISPNLLLNSFLNAQIGHHVRLRHFEERYEPKPGLMPGSLMQKKGWYNVEVNIKVPS